MRDEFMFATPEKPLVISIDFNEVPFLDGKQLTLGTEHIEFDFDTTYDEYK